MRVGHQQPDAYAVGRDVPVGTNQLGRKEFCGDAVIQTLPYPVGPVEQGAASKHMRYHGQRAGETARGV